jgi:hypothetical protein
MEADPKDISDAQQRLNAKIFNRATLGLLDQHPLTK